MFTFCCSFHTPQKQYVIRGGGKGEDSQLADEEVREHKEEDQDAHGGHAHDMDGDDDASADAAADGDGEDVTAQDEAASEDL